VNLVNLLPIGGTPVERAQSLAFLFLLGRTQGSPKTTPYPPAASADRRQTERETPRLRTLVSALIFDAR
jgi:hypothetical protein